MDTCQRTTAQSAVDMNTARCQHLCPGIDRPHNDQIPFGSTHLLPRTHRTTINAPTAARSHLLGRLWYDGLNGCHWLQRASTTVSRRREPAQAQRPSRLFNRIRPSPHRYWQQLVGPANGTDPLQRQMRLIKFLDAENHGGVLKESRRLVNRAREVFKNPKIGSAWW